MKKDLIYNIDYILKDEDKRTITIQGWGINGVTKTLLAASVKDNFNIESVVVKEKHRNDVNNLFQLDPNSCPGFLIVIKVKSFKGMIRIELSDGKEHRRISVNLKRPNKAKNTSGDALKNIKINIKKSINYFKRNGLKNTMIKIKKKMVENTVSEYGEWIQQNEVYDITKVKEEITQFERKPLVSIAMPVYNVEEEWLSKCIESVKNQYYENWELCIADDCSTKKHVKPLLQHYAEEDSRIKVVYREKNGHICEATNSALAIASGEYVGLLDNDDELAPFALYEVVKLINEDPKLDLIYSDEDKIDANGQRKDSVFKSDWSPDMLLGTNYICHFGVYRKSIVDAIGGFRKGYEGAQDYDLVLRFTEQADRIGHVAKILYHWRMLDTSTAVNQDSKGYAFEAGKRAVQDALDRRQLKGKAEHGLGLGLYDVAYDILSEDLVSVIIPTRDGYDDLKKSVDSIFEKTTYQNYEIIIADNGTTDKKTLELFDTYQNKYENLLIEHIDIPFNFSKINNLAAKKAKGKYLLFLNNDTEVITPEWITKMVSFAQFERIGAVGAKLCFSDDTIQHAGVILGLGGAAGHGHLDFPRNDFGYFGRLAINCNYAAVTAACMMVKKADFDLIGGFNEELTIAFNDVDLCLRLYKQGKYNVWLHDVELYHYESKSRGMENSPEKLARFECERDYMLNTWKECIENDPFYNVNLARNNGNYSLRK